MRVKDRIVIKYIIKCVNILYSNYSEGKFFDYICSILKYKICVIIFFKGKGNRKECWIEVLKFDIFL